MKHKKKMYSMFFIIMFFVISIGYTIIMPNAVKINQKSIQDKIIEISNKETITVDEIVEFPWDKIYIMQSNSSKEDILNTLNLKYDEKDFSKDDVNYIVFVKNDKVVCCLYENYNNGIYSFDFKAEYNKKGYFELNNKDLVFKVSKNDKIVKLTRK